MCTRQPSPSQFNQLPASSNLTDPGTTATALPCLTPSPSPLLYLTYHPTLTLLPEQAYLPLGTHTPTHTLTPPHRPPTTTTHSSTGALPLFACTTTGTLTGIILTSSISPLLISLTSTCTTFGSAPHSRRLEIYMMAPESMTPAAVTVAYFLPSKNSVVNTWMFSPGSYTITQWKEKKKKKEERSKRTSAKPH